MRSPGTRLNSPVLLVTKMRPRDRACAAIICWAVHRIHAHIALSVPALLLERVAEQGCEDTWRDIRDDSRQMKLAQLLSPNGTGWQVTEPGPDAATGSNPATVFVEVPIDEVMWQRSSIRYWNNTVPRRCATVSPREPRAGARPCPFATPARWLNPLERKHTAQPPPVVPAPRALLRNYNGQPASRSGSGNHPLSRSRKFLLLPCYFPSESPRKRRGSDCRLRGRTRVW